MSELVALDFETANPQRISACSVGGCVISNGEIVDRFATLIKPPTDYFAPINVRIHHITPDMVVDAPTFADLFPKFRRRVEHRTVLSYSKFDLSVINSLLDYFGCACKFEHIDVCQLARQMLPNLKDHKLPTVAKALGLGSFNHHDAAEDAVMCARVFLALSEGQSFASTRKERTIADSFSDFIDAILEDGVVDYKEAVELRSFLEVLPQHPVIGELLAAVVEFLEDGVIDSAESQWLVESLRMTQSALGSLLDEPVLQTAPVEESPASADDHEHPLFGKRIVIDGPLSRFNPEATRAFLSQCGGVYQENVTKKTDVFVIPNHEGYNPPPGYKSSRRKLAERYAAQGCPILLLDEQDFYKIIDRAV